MLRVERSRDVAAECGKAEKDSGGRVLRGAAKSGGKAVQGEEKSVRDEWKEEGSGSRVGSGSGYGIPGYGIPGYRDKGYGIRDTESR